MERMTFSLTYWEKRTQGRPQQQQTMRSYIFGSWIQWKNLYLLSFKKKHDWMRERAAHLVFFSYGEMRWKKMNHLNVDSDRLENKVHVSTKNG